jgi:hypothetical protein
LAVILKDEWMLMVYPSNRWKEINIKWQKLHELKQNIHWNSEN